MKNKIVQAIYEVFDELNSERELGNQLVKADNTVILGADGKLDSLGLVTLIVFLEEKLNDSLGIDITLADERAMSLEVSPFKTVSTLTDYVQVLIRESGHE